MKKYITRNIFLLALISLFTDVASEMLFPVLPIFMESIGLSVLTIAFIESASQLFGGALKAYFGAHADIKKDNVSFVRFGYGISGLAKPLMGIFSSAWGILGLRMVDRFGKSTRTAPRDAILTNESSQENRAKVFSFHRGMDTLGATLGPIVAIAWLFSFPQEYTKLFFLTIIPGLIAFAATLMLVRKKKRSQKKISGLVSISKTLMRFKNFYRSSDLNYKKLLILGFALSFIYSSEMFIILRLRELIDSDVMVIALYMLFNLSFIIISLPIGKFADKHGYQKMFLLGISVLSLVFFSLSFNLSLAMLFGIMALYAVFATVYQSLSVAWLSLFIPLEMRGTGIGLFKFVQALALFFGALLMGWLWTSFDSTLAFSVFALLGLVSLGVFYRLDISEGK